MKNTRLLLIAILFLAFSGSCWLTANAQQQSTTLELGPELYSTLPQSKGARWVIRGNLYPAGTWTPAPGQPLPRSACDLPGDVQPVGQYAIFGEVGSAGEHTATYVLRFNGVQYVFSGFIQYVEESPGILGATLFRAGKLRVGVAEETDPPTMVELTPRSTTCFGGLVRIFSE